MTYLTNRDVAVLEFLWKWKLSTTRALHARFFQDCNIETAYKRLTTLRNAGFIRFQILSSTTKFVWALDKKGFLAIKPSLPTLNEEGFRSEYPDHDLIVSAFHLGDWLNSEDNIVSFFSEQELRRIDPDFYPTWVPKTRRLHRPDGYWHFSDDNTTIALEVEQNLKHLFHYTGDIRDFYENAIPEILSVLWLVPTLGNAEQVNSRLTKQNPERKLHNFILLGDFRKHGWQSTIRVGPHRNQTVKNVLCKSVRSCSEVPLTDLYFDHRKFLLKSQACGGSNEVQNSN